MTTTEDAFLGGRLNVRQPKQGYRAGADPVFLAASVPAKSQEAVLELGCGAGVAMLCLLSRVPGLTAVGVDLSVEAVELARDNLSRNDLSGSVYQGDIAQMPGDVRAQTFDHVMANPPFFDRSKGSRAPNTGRETGRGEETDLFHWVDSAVKRVRPGGTLTVIQRIERLPDLMHVLDDRLGDVGVLPLAPRSGRPAKLFIMQAKKGAKGAFQLMPPFVLHDGDSHEKDADSYSTAAKSILRDGQALPLRD